LLTQSISIFTSVARRLITLNFKFNTQEGKDHLMAPLLEVKNLKTQFKSKDGIVKAVDDVSFVINKGETLGVVGESGSGKSVTALSVLRLVQSPGKVIGGEILFEGRDLLKLPDKEMRKIRGKDIAMIFQDPMTSLNPVLTIGRQLAEPLMTHLGLSEEQAPKSLLTCLKWLVSPMLRNVSGATRIISRVGCASG